LRRRRAGASEGSGCCLRLRFGFGFVGGRRIFVTMEGESAARCMPAPR
jgi:hypothetical protein